ncbi:GDP/GTP exchange factor for ARF [Scheffersomyces spartinae]|uniref:GDP/GTP exchange factor for ARF n=1 Tax=Scheffersomyces spartinae TaxID=45513 RepID=A0A9P7V686_9ASCO|nr:GDP/GTP exchange factor for ARF [Scheffersomyces spartinae]KAG7192124.1 GDP/GTP exchange factor for ARF [Scheffersomyces spartinae]
MLANHQPAKSPTPGPLVRPFANLMSSTSNTPGAESIGRGVAVDPITLVINECMAMAAAMRKMSRWSQSGVAAILGTGDIFGTGEEDTINTLASNLSNNRKTVDDNPLSSSFLQLRTILTEAKDVYEIDSLTMLQPFLLVVKSASTSGYITSMALNAISKFIDYEIISFKSKNLQQTLIQIITSLTHCRFEAADQDSDDAVLLKVLRLLEDIVKSPFSNLLPNETVSEVIQTCLSLACNKKRSEVLRRAAEMGMSSITFRIFNQLKYIEPEKITDEELPTDFPNTQLPADIIGGTEGGAETPVTNEKQESVKDEFPVSQMKPEPEPEHGQEQKDYQHPQIESKYTEEPFGITCLVEFMSILVSMISPSNQYQHMESTRVFALTLVNTSLEVAGTEVPNHPSLMNIVSGPIAKHVLQIMTTTESPALLKASLQLFSTIAIVLGRQLKSQIELSLTLLYQSILPEKKANDKLTDRNNITTRTSLTKEMLIESFSLMWTRTPVFFTHLFIDYDCDFERTDLSTRTLEFLCALALPESAATSTDNVPPICLEGILSFIGGINDRIKNVNADVNSIPLHQLIIDRQQKTSFIRCTEILNDKPKEGIIALQELGFIKDKDDIHEVAEFFFTKSGRLNKKVLGEFLAKPANKPILQEFIGLFDFSNLRVDEAIRVLLKSFRLPGEAQQIERVVELFAGRYVECIDTTNESEDSIAPDRDSVFVLSFSIIMLNTDLHNPQVKKPMQFSDYKNNVRGCYNGKDFPDWYLTKIYNGIKDREIIMPEEHHGTDKWFDDAWHNLISSRKTTYDALDFDLPQICQFDKVLFSSTVDKLIDTIFDVYRSASDDHVITSLMSTVDKCVNICLFYNLEEATDKIIYNLVELTSLSGEVRRIATNDDLREDIPVTQIRIDKKEEVITVSNMSVLFGRDFKGQLSAVVLFRLLKKNKCKVSPAWDKVLAIILRLFESCLINPNIFTEFQKKLILEPLPNVKPRYIINRSKPLNNTGILSTFSSFLRGYSDEPPEPTEQEIESTLSTIDCINSINISSIFESISKSKPDLRAFIELSLQAIPTPSSENKRVFEPEVLFLFEILVCFSLLLDDKSVTRKVNDAIKLDWDINKKGKLRLVVYKFLLARQTETEDLLDTLKFLTETFDKDSLQKYGEPAFLPLISLVDDDSWCCEQLLNNEQYWNSWRMFAPGQQFTKRILQLLEDLIKGPRKFINPNNYISVLGLLDEISSLSSFVARYEQEDPEEKKKRTEEQIGVFKELVEMGKISISLTAELPNTINPTEFKDGIEPYAHIQALAHQCFNPCREIRAFALSVLQAKVINIDDEKDYLTPLGIFDNGLLPLLAELSKPEVLSTDPSGFPMTQSEASSLVSKAFLQHITQMPVNDVHSIWARILDGFLAFTKVEQSSKVQEVQAEVLKNMILVLQSHKYLEQGTPIWTESWQKVAVIAPLLKGEFDIESGVTQNEEKSVPIAEAV